MNHTWVINEPEPIPEPSEIPQEVEIFQGDSMKVLKIETTLPTSEKEKMISFIWANQDVFARNTRICSRLTGRSYSIISMSTQNANLYSKSGEYSH